MFLFDDDRIEELSEDPLNEICTRTFNGGMRVILLDQNTARRANPTKL